MCYQFPSLWILVTFSEGRLSTVLAGSESTELSPGPAVAGRSSTWLLPSQDAKQRSLLWDKVTCGTQPMTSL